ncbi:hypothetical protein [Bradyrhizobium yuanmingense]|uniref:hypothetical protein n=1 Tax=Bradyrhizobium yuanmingense TaxID=108015 RepID=UPI0004B0B0A5|nr:hypothetical protein [Bradyrhizobium yuanmingense]
MITANVYRTEASQVAQFGERAFCDMQFSGKQYGEDAIRMYCESLARENDIIDPRIEIIITAN